MRGGQQSLNVHHGNWSIKHLLWCLTFIIQQLYKTKLVQIALQAKFNRLHSGYTRSISSNALARQFICGFFTIFFRFVFNVVVAVFFLFFF